MAGLCEKVVGANRWAINGQAHKGLPFGRTGGQDPNFKVGRSWHLHRHWALGYLPGTPAVA